MVSMLILELTSQYLNPYECLRLLKLNKNYRKYLRMHPKC